MSLISLIFNIILIDVCISEVGRLKPTPIDRICVENKDYVDASVMFRNEFWVIVDRMYYAYNWYAPPFVYKGEGLQELALQEYDRIGGKDREKDLKRGRYLGGFYQNTIGNQYFDSTNISMDDFTREAFIMPYQEPNEVLNEEEPPHVNGRPSNRLKNPFEYIMTTDFYFENMSKTQVIVYKEEYINVDRYHYKRMNVLDGTPDGLVEAMTAFVDHSGSSGPLSSRGAVDKLLKIGSPKSSVSLPMVLDFPTLTLFVIINQNESLDIPRLYYNSFKYTQFNKTWRYVPIPKGYRYNAFIPILLEKQPLELGEETIRYFKYNVIAEPFRDTKTDKQRGPSSLFELEFTWNILRHNSTKPKLIKLPNSGMSLFNCQFITASSLILYISFGLIIVFLAIILFVMVCFVSINYFYGKQRIVILKRKTRKRELSEAQQIRADSLDGGPTQLRQKTNADVSVADKRSVNPSIESDRKKTTSLKKIKI